MGRDCDDRIGVGYAPDHREAGVPLKDRLVNLMRDGCTPQQVSDDIRERNVKYLERTKTKSKKMRANP